MSFPSDFFLEDDTSLASNEFYAMVTEEKNKIKAQHKGHGFRWDLVRDALKECHPYFAAHDREQIRSRHKYI